MTDFQNINNYEDVVLLASLRAGNLFLSKAHANPSVLLFHKLSANGPVALEAQQATSPKHTCRTRLWRGRFQSK